MLDYVVSALQGRDLIAVEKATKVSRWTQLKIRQRQIKNPGVKSIETLYHHLKLEETKQRRRAA